MGTMSEPTLKLRVYEGIKQLILSGKLRPGQKLAERDLGKTLKISRTPIREALGRLVQDGLEQRAARAAGTPDPGLLEARRQAASNRPNLASRAGRPARRRQCQANACFDVTRGRPLADSISAIAAAMHSAGDL